MPHTRVKISDKHGPIKTVKGEEIQGKEAMTVGGEPYFDPKTRSYWVIGDWPGLTAVIYEDILELAPAEPEPATAPGS